MCRSSTTTIGFSATAFLALAFRDTASLRARRDRRVITFPPSTRIRAVTVCGPYSPSGLVRCPGFPRLATKCDRYGFRDSPAGHFSARTGFFDGQGGTGVRGGGSIGGGTASVHPVQRR